MKNLSCGTQCGGFQFLLILDLWGINFQAVVVFVLGKNLLFKSVLGHCELILWNDISHEFPTKVVHFLTISKEKTPFYQSQYNDEINIWQ